MKKFRSVLIGSVDRSEFAEIAGQIRENSQSTSFSGFVEFERSISDAESSRSQTLPIFDLIVIFQSYPGEHSRAAWERIRKIFPLTPTVTVRGAWCEGELRTGFPLPATHRIYRFDWFTQGEKEFFALKNGGFSVWSLPTTFQDEEIILEKFNRRKDTVFRKTGENRTAWVFSCRNLSFPDREIQRLLHLILTHSGYQSRTLDHADILDNSSLSAPDLLVWDLGELGSGTLPATKSVLRELRRKAPNAHIVLLANSPRIEETRTLCNSGADRIVGWGISLQSE